jgi:hypothetical protein
MEQKWRLVMNQLALLKTLTTTQDSFEIQKNIVYVKCALFFAPSDYH